MEDKLLNLPWQIQTVLGSGYVAYLISYAGIRDQYKGADVTFRTFAFGLVASLVLFATSGLSPYFSIAAAFVATVCIGAGWRKYGSRICRSVAGKLKIAWADDLPTAWQSISVGNRDFPISQISVETDDGTIFQCTDAAKFKDAPFGPCVFGANGDVALYADHIRNAEGPRDVGDVELPHWGSEISYIPAAKIRIVHIRHYTGPSH